METDDVRYVLKSGFGNYLADDGYWSRRKDAVVFDSVEDARGRLYEEMTRHNTPINGLAGMFQVVKEERVFRVELVETVVEST